MSVWAKFSPGICVIRARDLFLVLMTLASLLVQFLKGPQSGPAPRTPLAPAHSVVLQYSGTVCD